MTVKTNYSKTIKDLPICRLLKKAQNFLQKHSGSQASSHYSQLDHTALASIQHWIVPWVTSPCKCALMLNTFLNYYGVILVAVCNIFSLKQSLYVSMYYYYWGIDIDIIFNLCYRYILLWHKSSKFPIRMNICYSWLPAYWFLVKNVSYTKYFVYRFEYLMYQKFQNLLFFNFSINICKISPFVKSVFLGLVYKKRNRIFSVTQLGKKLERLMCLKQWLLG